MKREISFLLESKQCESNGQIWNCLILQESCRFFVGAYSMDEYLVFLIEVALEWIFS